MLKSKENIFTQTLKLWCDYKVKFNFVTIPDDEDSGTVSALKYLKDKIKVGITFLFGFVPVLCFNVLLCHNLLELIVPRG